MQGHNCCNMEFLSPPRAQYSGEIQPTEWEEKISANHISDIGLLSRKYKELVQFNKKRLITQFKDGQRI